MTRICQYMKFEYKNDGSYKLDCIAKEPECPKATNKRHLGARCFSNGERQERSEWTEEEWEEAQRTKGGEE